MFSGIVQGLATVVQLERETDLLHLTLDLGFLADGVRLGASVSVAGVCLTVVRINTHQIGFDLINETLKRTNLGDLKISDSVNIERSVRVGDEIGGHHVSGHVTGTATISKLETPTNNHILTLTYTEAWQDYILPKGFIALDGCSLTIVDVGTGWFTVHLIPETLRVTTFGRKTVGDRINLEIDPQTRAIVDTVKHHLQAYARQ